MATIDRKRVAIMVIDQGFSEAEVRRAYLEAGVPVSEAEICRSVYEELRSRGRDWDSATYGAANEGAVYRDGVAATQDTRPALPHRTDLEVASIAAAVAAVKP